MPREPRLPFFKITYTGGNAYSTPHSTTKKKVTAQVANKGPIAEQQDTYTHGTTNNKQADGTSKVSRTSDGLTEDLVFAECGMPHDRNFCLQS